MCSVNEKKWKFFDEMNEICGHRATSTPVTVIDLRLQNKTGGKLNVVSRAQSHDSFISLHVGTRFVLLDYCFPV